MQPMPQDGNSTDLYPYMPYASLNPSRPSNNCTDPNLPTLGWPISTGPHQQKAMPMGPGVLAFKDMPLPREIQDTN